MGLNITVFSYLDSLEFGIVADREHLDDPWPILDALRAALDELRDLASLHASRAPVVSIRAADRPEGNRVEFVIAWTATGNLKTGAAQPIHVNRRIAKESSWPVGRVISLICSKQVLPTPAAMPPPCAPAKRDGDGWILNGSKLLDHQRRQVDVVHRDGRDRARQGRRRDLVVHGAQRRRGLDRRLKERNLGIKGSPTTELYFENCRITADRIISEPGTGFKAALATLDHTRPTIGAQAVGIAQAPLMPRLHTPRSAGTLASQSATSRVCSSPTWRCAR